MSHIKLSEFWAKKHLYKSLGQDYLGIQVNLEESGYEAQVLRLRDGERYVVKADQAVKKRNKQGLVFLDRSKSDVIGDCIRLKDRGYSYAIVEPFEKHEKNDERFVALMKKRAGIEVIYSHNGGVDVEEHADTLVSFVYGVDECLIPEPCTWLEKAVDVFERAHTVYLEINPLVISKERVLLLDAAVEVDSAAMFSVHGMWTGEDVRSAPKNSHNSEKIVEQLQATSPASLSLRMLNPNGGLFLLLSGGGASVVIADEFGSRGLASEIANYGEYSGNPTEDETYLYTKALLTIVKESSAPKKIIVIAGGVANFTDISKTFKGIVRALTDDQEWLRKMGVTVFVRRGGPNQENGLRLLREALEGLRIRGFVSGPELSIGTLVHDIAEEYTKS